MEKLKYIKIEHQDGTLSENVPIGVDANNVDVGNEDLSTKLNRLDANDTSYSNSITSLQSQVSSLASGSPLVANSTASMTDTTKTYVNTTNGYWYYYNGSSWVQGGVYLPTENADNSIDYIKLNKSIYSLFSEKTDITGFVIGGFKSTADNYIDTSITTRCCKWIDVDEYVKDTYFCLNNTNLIISALAFEFEAGNVSSTSSLSSRIENIGEGFKFLQLNAIKKVLLIYRKPNANESFTLDEVKSLVLYKYNNKKLFEIENFLNINNKKIIEKCEFGGISTSSGAEVTNTIRCRSNFLNLNEKNGNRIISIENLPDSMTLASVITYKDFVFNSSISFSNLIRANNKFIEFEKTSAFNSIRLVFQKDDGTSNISQEELNVINIIKLKEFDSPLEDKVYCAIGDSITYGFIPRNVTGYPGQLKSYVSLASSKIGLSPKNLGISGSTISNVENRNPMCIRYVDAPDNADIISVMGGTNDIRNGSIQLGTINDTTNKTFYGALKILAQGLYNKYYINQGVEKGQKKKIFFMTPLKLLYSSASELGGTGINYDMSLWCKAIKDVAEMFSFPVLDLQNLSQLNPALSQIIQGTETGYTGKYNPYMTDGTHPTQEGQEIISNIVAGFIESLY